MVIDTTTVSAQYSDHIPPLTITSHSADSTNLEATMSPPRDGLAVSPPSCEADEAGTACTWTLEGQALLPVGSYTTDVIVSDGTVDSSASFELEVHPEDARIKLDRSNPSRVSTAAETDANVSVRARVREVVPDAPVEFGAPGEIDRAAVEATLSPVGPGSPATTLCELHGEAGSGYDAAQTAVCRFEGVEPNAYVVKLLVTGDYYRSEPVRDVLVVFDPEQARTSGRGWFSWTDSESTAQFHYSVTSDANGPGADDRFSISWESAEGSVLGALNSNEIYGLAHGEEVDADTEETYRWAAFSGSATYEQAAAERRRETRDAKFLVYLEDHASPGDGSDRIWIEVRTAAGQLVNLLSIDEPAIAAALFLEGGDLAVGATP